MLLATGLQESLFEHRRQLVGNPPRPTGPAKSFWQGEEGGGMVDGVRRHSSTRGMAQTLYTARGVPPNNRAIWNAIENDDVLAAGLARLLYYSDPFQLPRLGDSEKAFELYVRVWRPGAYTRGSDQDKCILRNKWESNYKKALAYVQA